MALGQSMGALPRGKNYAREFDIPYNIAKPHKGQNARLLRSQNAPPVSQKGLGEILAANIKKDSINQVTKASVTLAKQKENKKKP